MNGPNDPGTPDLPVVPEPEPAATRPPDRRADLGKHGLGNIVVGAILVLLGIGWLLQAQIGRAHV